MGIANATCDTQARGAGSLARTQPSFLLQAPPLEQGLGCAARVPGAWCLVPGEKMHSSKRRDADAVGAQSCRGAAPLAATECV